MEGDYISFLYGQNIFLLFAGPESSQELIAFETIHFPIFYQDVDRHVLLEAINESNVRHPMVKTRLTKDRAVSFTFEFLCTTPKIKKGDVFSMLGMLECVSDAFSSIITEVKNQKQDE